MKILVGGFMKQNTYKLSDIDCAACALKIEEGVSKLEGVNSCRLNYILSKLFVEFDENMITDEEIELCVHKSLSGVRIVEKNNSEFIDTYEEPNVFKKILFRGRKNRPISRINNFNKINEDGCLKENVNSDSYSQE